MPEKSAEFRAKHRLEFPVLSDAGNVYAKSLSLAFALPEDLRGVYRGFGIVLPEFNGDETWELPMPARLVVGMDGVIRSIDADPDYTLRPEPDATLEVLRGMA